MNVYDVILHPVVMPWWGWVGLGLVNACVAVQARMRWEWFVLDDLEKKRETFANQLSYISAMAIKHIGACGCHAWDKCPIHGGLEFRIQADPKVAAVLEAAEVLETARFAQRFRSATEDNEFRQREEDKRRRKELAQADAAAEAEERDARERVTRDRLGREAELAREREILAHAAAETERLAAIEHKQRVWDQYGPDVVQSFLGMPASSPPRKDGGV